jgi:hypothetical protein
MVSPPATLDSSADERQTNGIAGEIEDRSAPGDGLRRGVLDLRRHEPPRYGLTYDAPALFYAGDRTLYSIQHPSEKGALDLEQQAEPPNFTTRFVRNPAFDDPMHYPVLPGLVSAVTSRVFHDRLHLLDDVEGHHLGLVLLHSIALFFFCAYLYRLLGPVGAAAGTVALALFPSALASSFNNPKDWPCAQYYGIAVLAAGLGVVSGRARHLMWAAVFLGVSLSCKFNAVFVLPTFYLWLPIAYAALYWRRRRMAPGVAAMTFAFPYVSVLFFFLAWPWLLHGNNIAVWWDHVSEYVHNMVHRGRRSTVLVELPAARPAASRSRCASGERAPPCIRGCFLSPNRPPPR